jgi:hypothetical protein
MHMIESSFKKKITYLFLSLDTYQNGPSLWKGAFLHIELLSEVFFVEKHLCHVSIQQFQNPFPLIK